jgi:UDP-N-acetylmuramoylalanine--D-glutamate ligase
MIDIVGKKIGVWGLGIVGRSVLTYLYDKHCTLSVLDRTRATAEQQEFCQSKSIHYYSEDAISDFFECNDYIIPSPGVDIARYTHVQHKWLAELDLFYHAWQKPIIAITGTLGKTSVTSLLWQILRHHGNMVATGGNIGVGSLDLLKDYDQASVALLEVSSFQLETCKNFAPDLALITNIYPNHLDRHKNLQDYFLAKYKILAHQQQYQKALLPLELLPQIRAQAPTQSRPLAFFSYAEPTSELELQLGNHDIVYYRSHAHNVIIKKTRDTEHAIIDNAALPSLSYPANWLSILGALDLMGIEVSNLKQAQLALPAHRLDHVATLNGRVFYNDSKSTVPEATLAAVNKLSGNPIILFLGGYGKGVDRSDLVNRLTGKVKHIICFGAEAQLLQSYCLRANISASAHATLEEAFCAALDQSQAGDALLFSPAGASFDLFANYQERGEHFKQLVTHAQEIACTKK